MAARSASTSSAVRPAAGWKTAVTTTGTVLLSGGARDRGGGPVGHAVDAPRGAGEELGALSGVEPGGELVEGGVQRPEGGVEAVDREVAGEHAARRPEHLDRVEHDPADAVDGPRVVVGAERRDLDRGVRLGGEDRQLVLPPVESVAVPVDRHAGVVEHDRQVPVVGREGGGLPQLVGEDLQVEGEARLGDGAQAREPGRLGHEVGAVPVGEHRVVVPVEDVANPAHCGERGVRRELLPGGGGGQVDLDHLHGRDPVGRAHRVHPSALPERVGRPVLHVDRAHEPPAQRLQRRRVGQVVVDQVVAPERAVVPVVPDDGWALQPGVGGRAELAQVVVRVDDVEVEHRPHRPSAACRARDSATPEWSRSPSPSSTARSYTACTVDAIGRARPCAEAAAATNRRSLTWLSMLPPPSKSPVSQRSPFCRSASEPARPPPSSSSSCRRSIPWASASTSASDSAPSVAATTTWLQAFATSPAPGGPRWRTVDPTSDNAGQARPTASGVPPTMTLRAPDSAPAVPPLTGASTTSTPAPASRSASAATATGETVPCTTRTGRSTPAAAQPASRPSSPSSSCSTSPRSVSTVRVMRAAASAGRLATRAPADRSASALAGVRFQTVSEPRAASRRRAIGSPIRPRPSSDTSGVLMRRDPPGRPGAPGRLGGPGRRGAPGRGPRAPSWP